MLRVFSDIVQMILMKRIQKKIVVFLLYNKNTYQRVEKCEHGVKHLQKELVSGSGNVYGGSWRWKGAKSREEHWEDLKIFRLDCMQWTKFWFLIVLISKILIFSEFLCWNSTYQNGFFLEIDPYSIKTPYLFVRCVQRSVSSREHFIELIFVVVDGVVEIGWKRVSWTLKRKDEIEARSLLRDCRWE